jgi:hypothetical protein
MKKPTLFQIMRSVFRAWFGVQTQKNLERDFQHGKASDFIIVGIMMAILFVLIIAGVVSLVVPG